MKKMFKKTRRGMTLIELVIYLAITMITVTLVLDLVSRMAQVKNVTTGQETVVEENRFLQNRLAFAIRAASSANLEAPDTLTLTKQGQTTKYIFNSIEKTLAVQEDSLMTPLSSNLVEVSLPEGESRAFSRLTNGQAQSVRVTLKLKYKESNFSQTLQFTTLLKGK